MKPRFSSEIHSAFIAHSGKFSSPSNTRWIINSGVTNHMTGLQHLFNSYFPCSTGYCITIANGTCSPIVGIGTNQLSAILVLKSVLHVPSLQCNLISVYKLIRDNHCFC